MGKKYLFKSINTLNSLAFLLKQPNKYLTEFSREPLKIYDNIRENSLNSLTGTDHRAFHFRRRQNDTVLLIHIFRSGFKINNQDATHR